MFSLNDVDDRKAAVHTSSHKHFRVGMDTATEAALLRRVQQHHRHESLRSQSPTTPKSPGHTDHPTAAERAARRNRNASPVTITASTDAALNRRVAEVEQQLAVLQRKLADEVEYSSQLAEENQRLQGEVEAKAAVSNTENEAHDMNQLREQLIKKDAQIRVLKKNLNDEKDRVRIAEERVANATPDGWSTSTASDAELAAANAELRKRLVVARFREGGLAAQSQLDQLEVLRTACPNVDRTVLEKTLREAKGDLKVAMVHLQTNHRTASFSAPHRSSSKATVRSSKPGVRTSKISGDRLVVLSVRGKDTKLGLKFKSEHGPSGESTGDQGLEITEITPGSIADQSGELSVGDILVKINSESLIKVPMSVVRRILRVSETYKILVKASTTVGASTSVSGQTLPKPEDVEGAEPEMAKIILGEIVDNTQVQMSDVIGLKKAKQSLTEIVIFPSLYPEMFTGLRKPCKGLLLFGPPGNGKTLLAKAIASTAQSTFFAISASSLTSKWVGQSEKLVRALFACGRATQPSIIFIDEVDSILSERRSGGQEGSARLKTEFLVSFDGVGAGDAERVLVMAATNLPWEIDSAAMRRLPKRVYVPMPNEFTRHDLVRMMLNKGKEQGTENDISSADMEQIVTLTAGYSNSDISSLVREAAAEPMREAMQATPIEQMLANHEKGKAMTLRAMILKDFVEAAKTIKPSYGREMLDKYEAWAEQYGTEDAMKKTEVNESD